MAARDQHGRVGPRLLLVALLQNSERRSDRAASRKLDGITAALADLLAAPLDGIDRETLARRISELRATINVRRADLSRLAPRPPSARAFHLCTTKRARHRRGRGTVAGHRGNSLVGVGSDSCFSATEALSGARRGDPRVGGNVSERRLLGPDLFGVSGRMGTDGVVVRLS